MNEIKINSPSTFRFEIEDKVGYWNDESPSTQSYFGKFYLYNTLIDDMAFYRSHASKNYIQFQLEIDRNNPESEKLKNLLSDKNVEIEQPFSTDKKISYIIDADKVKIVDLSQPTNEIKVNTPGIKAQVYPWQATPEKIELYNKIAAQTYALLSKLAQELNLDVSNFRASFDGLYYGLDERDRNKTDLTIQIKDPNDTWKEPWTGNALIPQTVSGEGLCLWTYSGNYYNKNESEVLSQLIPIIVNKEIIKLMFRFALQVRNNLTPEEKELIAPNTPILVTGKDLKEIKISRPVNKLFKFVVTKKSDINYWRGELYFKNELIDDDAVFSGNSSDNWIVAYINSDQTELQKDMEPYISQNNDGGFFHPMTNNRNKKIFHIQGDQLKDRVDMVDELDEIKISRPANKLFKFVVTKKFDILDWEGRLYFRNELIDKDARLVEDSSKRWIIAYIDPDQTELQKDLEPHISRFDNGKFFTYSMEGDDVKKAFHIKEDQLENRVDIVDELDEIRISKPENKLFKFVITEKRYNSNVRGDVDNWIGKLYFRDKLIDENAFLLNKKILIANVGSNQTELQKTLEPYISQYNTGGFFVNSNLRNMKSFHIQGDQLKDRVDIVDELDEIKVNKPSGELYPIVDVEGDINYKNLVKNVKKFKRKIAAKLQIEDTNLLNRLLTFYVNAFTEVEHQGEQGLYLDITVDEMIADIKGWYEGSQDDDWEPDPEYDVVTIEDIAEIKINKPGKAFTFVYKGPLHSGKEGEFYFGNTLLDKRGIYSQYNVATDAVKRRSISFGVDVEFYPQIKDQLRPYAEDAFTHDNKVILTMSDLSPVNLKGIDNVDEIKINFPGWKNFEAEIIDEDGEINILEIHHPEGQIYWFGHMEQGPDVINVEFGGDDPENEEYFAEQLTDILRKYNRPFERINIDDEMFWIQIPKSIVDIVDEVNEIKVSPPSTRFEFPLIINNQKDYDSYTKLLLQSGKYWFRNADGNLDDISSLVWPYVRPDNNPFPFCIKLNHYNPNVMHAVPGSACGIKEIKVKTPVNRIFTFVYNESINSSKKVGKFYFKDILLDDKAGFFNYVKNGLRQNFIAFGVDVDLYPQIKDQLLPYIDKIGEKADAFNHGGEVVLTISDLSLVHLKEINNIKEIKVKSPKNIIPLEFKKLITNYTGWNEGKEYSIDVAGFPEISATTYDDEPDVVYLYSKIGISDVKSLLDRLNIPYEELLKNVLVDKKYFSNYKVD